MTTTPELTWRQALAWRMERHGLAGRPFGSALEVAEALCGLHAQVMSSAELTAAARTAEPAPLTDDVHDSLVKTWAVRGTLHLLPASELPLWHAALSTYEHFLKGAWLRAFGFASTDEVEAMIAAIGDALDGRTLTREELAEAVPEHADKLRESWGTCLKPAAFRGLLAFAESSGTTVRFTRPPQADRPPPEEAVRALTRKYLAAYAPARREDLSRWWGTNALSPAKAQKRFEALGEEATVVDVEGSRCWVLTEDLDALREAAPQRAATLVPLFDQYVVNSNRDVEPLLAAAAKPLVFRQAGWISAAVLVDGAIAGVWRHERKGQKIEIAIAPFAPLAKWARTQVADEAERLGAFLGGTPAIRWEA